MSPVEIVALLALSAYAVYRQTKRTEVMGAGRFTMAIIYGVVGLVVGGFRFSGKPAEIALLVVSIALSLAVGLLRARYTRVEAEDGRVFSQGTALTIGLFLAMVAVKFGIGTVAALSGVDADGGFGEVLVMIGIMLAVQSELIWRRARCLGARDSRDDGPVPHATSR